MLISEIGVILGALALRVNITPAATHTVSILPNPTTISYETRELKRIPHQSTHYPLVLFSMPAQDYRKDTAIRFSYHPPAQGRPMYLQLQRNGSYDDIALIYHPLLSGLSWQKTHVHNAYLYQKNTTANSIEAFLANPPPQTELAADRVAARTYGLNASQYTRLDTLTDLNGINYILTSYQPSPNDGWWDVFDQSFDLSNVAVNSQNEIVGRISTTDDESPYSTPFYIGEFHVDYKKMRP